MRYIQKWTPFLNENFQQAKDYLIKREREKIFRENPGKSFKDIQLTPEQRDLVLLDPDFLKIKNFLEKKGKIGLTYPWTYFLKEDPPLPIGEIFSQDPKNPEALDQITATNLYYIYNYWNSVKGDQKLKYGTPEGYVNAKEQKKLSDSAWNTLWDEIQELLQERATSKFIKEFPRNIRDYYKEILEKKDNDSRSKKLYDKSITYVNLLLSCPERVGEIEVRDRDTGKVTHKYPNQAKYHVIKQAGKYDDFKTYPNFQNTLVAYVDLLDTIKSQIDSDGKSLSVSLQEIKDLEPQIKILYISDKPYIMLSSSRSFQGVQKICQLSQSTLCIRDYEQFFLERYSDCILIHINQFEKDSSDPDYLITMHVHKSLKVEDWSNAKNRKEDANQRPIRLNNNTLSELLVTLGVPKVDEIIQHVKNNFDQELALKNIMEIIYTEKKTSAADSGAILNLLGRIELKSLNDSKKFTEEEIKSLFDTVLEIIKTDYNFTKEKVIDYYLQSRIFTFSDYLIFKHFSQTIDLEQLNKILEESEVKLKRISKNGSWSTKFTKLLDNFENSKIKINKDLGIEK